MFHPVSWTLNFLATCSMYLNVDDGRLVGLRERHCVGEHREEPTDLMLVAEVSVVLFFLSSVFYLGFVA